MDTFYCAGCRTSYPVEKLARLIPSAHRDGEQVGFCFLCARDEQPREEAIVGLNGGRAASA